jgi:hypothetical protein
MMKLTAAAAIGALILAASAAPAIAGGYWDGGIVQGGQAADPPAHWDRDCPCYCPRDRDDYSGRREERGDRDEYYGSDRGWSDERVYDSGWQDQGQDEGYVPDASSDNGYGVGPDGFIDDGGSSGVFVVGGGSAFADANAFGNVGVDFDFRDRFRDHDRFHDRDFHDRDFHDRDMSRDHDRRMFDRDDHLHVTPQHGYQHMGAWGGASMPMHMAGGHMSGFSHTAMHGGAVMHGGGGRRR